MFACKSCGHDWDKHAPVSAEGVYRCAIVGCDCTDLTPSVLDRILPGPPSPLPPWWPHP